MLYEVITVYDAVLHHPLIEKEMAQRWNIKYFGPVFLPPYEFMGNKRIASTADMKGVKMRISGLNAKALQVFGAVPTMVTAPEGYTALERGTIDSFGFPVITSYSIHYTKLYETHVLTRDERSAAYMADGYARVSGRVGVCEGPSGGGATYILPGLVEANESSVPILAITTDVSVSARGRYTLTELDQGALMRPLTKWNAVLDRAADRNNFV